MRGCYRRPDARDRKNGLRARVGLFVRTCLQSALTLARKPRERMVFLSLAHREMSAASRRRRLWLVRLIVALAFFLAIPVRLADPEARVDGSKLFELLSWMAFVYCIFAGVFRTCDTLAEEKREGTLGLLLLTDLSPRSVLLGKMISASATTFFGLLAMLPMLALPILMGGVPGWALLRVCVSLLNTLFLSIAWGFFISAVARKHIATTLLAFAALLFFGGLIFLIAMTILVTYENELIGLQVALWSPTFTHFASFYSTRDAIEFFNKSIAFNHVLAWGFLCFAAMLFPRRSQDIPQTAASERWQKRIREWRYGAPRDRIAYRKNLLRQNPVVWFVNRDRLNSRLLVIVCFAMLLIGHLLNNDSAMFFNFFESIDMWTLLAVNMIVLFRVASEASHTLSEDQKSGALELLLATRLTVLEIIQGRVYALFRQFAPVLALIIGWQVAVLTARHADHADLAIALSIWLAATLFTIAWVGSWIALRAKRSATATWMTLGVVIGPPFIAWFGSILPSTFDSDFRDIQTMALIVCAAIGTGYCFWLFLWARRMLFKNFRAAVEDRFVARRFEPISSFKISEARVSPKFENLGEAPTSF